MKKPILIVAVVVLVAVGAGIFFLASNLNSLVASAIEKHGSDVTETRVNVNGLEITLREGRGSISGLTVASPAGYRAKNVFVLDDITIDLDVGSVREDPIVIDEIRISAPVIHAEVKKDGGSNVGELRKKVQSYSANSDDAGKSQKKIRIKKFVFEKGKIELDAADLGVEKRSVDLPEIRMTDVGGESGVPPDEVAKVILTAVAGKAVSEVAKSGVKSVIKDKLGDIEEKAKGLLDKIGG